LNKSLFLFKEISFKFPTVFDHYACSVPALYLSKKSYIFLTTVAPKSGEKDLKRANSLKKETLENMSHLKIF